jgi:hypothetical protein
MDTHRVNLYEIEEKGRLGFEYRLAEVEGLDRSTVKDGDLVERNLNTLAMLVAVREKCPVAIVRESDRFRLAVPAKSKLENLEYHLAPDVVTLKPLNEVYPGTFCSQDGKSRHVAMSFLNFCLRGSLRTHPTLWSSSSHTFFSKVPVNGRELSREIDLYEGFHFHVRYLGEKLFVGIKLAHKYVDTAWAVDRFSADELKNLKMRMFLYHFGSNWFTIQLLEALGKSIEETRFIPNGSDEAVSVFDYTIEKVGKNSVPWIRSLDPKSPAILYRYQGRDQRLFAALALAKLIHRTEDDGARELHRLSIKNPEDRFTFSLDVIRQYFRGINFFGAELRIRETAHSVRPNVYPVPTLEFGQGRLLRIGEDSKGGETALADLGRTRMNLLSDRAAGVAVSSTLEPQYILIPQSLDRAIATDISRRLEAVTRSFLQASYRLDTVLYDDRNARTLKQHVDAILLGVQQANVKHGRGILILPANGHSDLHNFVKRALRERLQFQCLDAGKVASFYHTILRKGIEPVPNLERRYGSYLRYAALGLLIVNRQWGWVLQEGTRYDAYICFDVLNHLAAFTFFYEGGRHCYTRPCESKQSEKLLRQQVRTMVYEGLKADLASVKKPKSIILQRDGRLFRAEWLGFQEAIEQLIREGLLDEQTVWGGIEIAKKFGAGLRLVEEIEGRLHNPVIGTALALEKNEGIVATTGYPFSLRGTSAPILVRVVGGSLNLDWVMEDVFRKSLLAWSNPDHCMGIPIDLKLCDEYLRAFASDANDEEAVYGQEVEDAADVA